MISERMKELSGIVTLTEGKKVTGHIWSRYHNKPIEENATIKNVGVRGGGGVDGTWIDATGKKVPVYRQLGVAREMRPGKAGLNWSTEDQYLKTDVKRHLEAQNN